MRYGPCEFCAWLIVSSANKNIFKITFLMEIFSDPHTRNVWQLMQQSHLHFALVSSKPSVWWAIGQGMYHRMQPGKRDITLSEGWSGLRWQTHTVFWSVASIYFWGFALAKDVLQDCVSDRPLVWGPPAGVTCLRCSDSGKVQSQGSANTRAALPPDGPRESFFPLVCWQIAQLWCYMSALALRISRDKPGMFCMPGSGAEPLHWDNLLEGTMGPGWTRRVGNPLMLWAAAL